MVNKIKIILADDHDLVRTGIRRILEDEASFSIIAEARTGDEAVKLSRKHLPDVVLMDVNMPGMDGVDATKIIARMKEDVRVLCLSMYKDEPVPSKVMSAGAFGFITKDAAPKEMIAAVYKVASGQKYLTADIAQAIALSKLSVDNDNPFNMLSEREMGIAQRISLGRKVPDIAVELNINTKTVNTYRYRMFEKLGVSSDVELAHLAIRYKVIDPGCL